MYATWTIQPSERAWILGKTQLMAQCMMQLRRSRSKNAWINCRGPNFCIRFHARRRVNPESTKDGECGHPIGRIALVLLIQGSFAAPLHCSFGAILGFFRAPVPGCGFAHLAVWLVDSCCLQPMFTITLSRHLRIQACASHRLYRNQQPHCSFVCAV